MAVQNIPIGSESDLFAEQLIARTRTILWIALFAGLTFLALELALATRLAAPFVVKCIGVTLTTTALVVVQRPWAKRWARSVSFTIVLAAYFLTAISGIVSPSREYATTAVLFVGGALTTATLLPWGLWPQLGTMLFAIALLCGAIFWAGNDLWVLTGDPAAAVAIAFVLSVASTYQMQRQRVITARELAARRQAEAELRALNAVLEQRVTERTRELQSANNQLQGLSARLESVREEERTRIAREIHDELGQLLTALKIDIDLLPKRIAAAEDESSAHALHQKLAAMSALSDTMIHTVQRIATELRPSVLDDLGLREAIAWQARQFEHLCGVVCTFTCEPHAVKLDPARSTAIFRVVQETLTNVARHARAANTAITLREDANQLVLEVRDDGRGVTDAELRSPTSLGLLGIRERARLLGGDVDIAGLPGLGTTVRVRIPQQT